MHLDDGVVDKLIRIKKRYEHLSTQLSSERDLQTKTVLQKEKDGMEIFMSCLKALETIQNDLEIFSDHLTGDDKKLKDVAETYTDEFITCRDQIHSQLNTLVPKYSIKDEKL
eukprot:CAMPEP_0182428794 /NCGR_PEP_ID=MMETSP1167-20130531/23713_1 /TAXON_ID=2988 /ORGANISM="Mallomonas Sp, Strain CCMP3275" /LENGTH=111 /DNA_ID=CAMNT_0024611903 /DNA_START=220 /DNA_END=555 /DNA_ORIENTATION=-